MLKSNNWKGLVVGLLAMTLPLTAVSGESGEDAWQFEFAGYLWGASIGGTSAAGDDIDIPFSDLVDDLDVGFMGLFEARKGKWDLLADVIYLDVSDKDTETANLIGRPVETDLKVDLKGWIVTAGVSYAFMETSTTRISLKGGVRYLWLDVDVDFDLGPATAKYSDSGDIWDGIVGLRGTTNLSDKWYLYYYADVGAGDSDYTWQALAGLNYRFKKVDAAFGYRYLKWKFDDNDTFDDLDLSGPYAGVNFRF